MTRRGGAMVLMAAMPDLYPLFRPLLRRLPAEAAHELTLCGLACGLGRTGAPARARPAGSGATPVGPRFSQSGRPRRRFRQGRASARRAAAPRLRLRRDRHGDAAAAARQSEAAPLPSGRGRAVINRMGFNSDGLDVAAGRLAPTRRDAASSASISARTATASTPPPITRRRPPRWRRSSITSSSTSRRRTRRACAICSGAPNWLRCSSGCSSARRDGSTTPLLVKIAPDLTQEERQTSPKSLRERHRRADRHQHHHRAAEELRSPRAIEAGGLSGPPLFAPSTALLAEITG